MHVANGKREQARKRPCENRGSEEEGHAPLYLIALVVHADEVQASGHDASLKEAKKDPAAHKSSIVRDKAHADG